MQGWKSGAVEPQGPRLLFQQWLSQGYLKESHNSEHLNCLSGISWQTQTNPLNSIENGENSYDSLY